MAPLQQASLRTGRAGGNRGADATCCAALGRRAQAVTRSIAAMVGR